MLEGGLCPLSGRVFQISQAAGVTAVTVALPRLSPASLVQGSQISSCSLFVLVLSCARRCWDAVFSCEEYLIMASSVFGVLLSGLLATAVIATPYAAFAQEAPKTELNKTELNKTEVKLAAKADSTDDAKAEAKTKRPLTAQQLKLKECGAKWQDEKKTKGVKGLEAWNKFRSDCLKS
jgi:hypothetical protein